MNNMTVDRYKRIAIYGHSGSGKSSLAQILSARLGLPMVELDALYHVNSWEDTPWDEFRAKLQRALESHTGGWVTAGNYLRSRDLVMDQADLVIWLRLPFPVVYWRLALRTLRALFTREPLWEGTQLRESWRQTFFSRNSILLWGITSWRPHIHRMTEAIAAPPPGAEIRVLRSHREVIAFLAELPNVGGKVAE